MRRPLQFRFAQSVVREKVVLQFLKQLGSLSVGSFALSVTIAYSGDRFRPPVPASPVLQRKIYVSTFVRR